MKKISMNIVKDIAIVIAFLFLIIFSINSSNTQTIEPHPVYKLNDGWDISVNQNIQSVSQLPVVVDANANDDVSISRTLDFRFSTEQTILIRGSLQSIQAKLDDNIIYTKTFEDNVFNTHASLFHFIDIPENASGQILEISFQTPFRDFSGTQNEVYFGTPSAIHTHLMSTYGPKLIIGLIWFVISLLIVAFNFIFFSKKDRYYSYIALFGVFMSLWLMNESRILQLYINNDFIIGSLSYISIAAAPIAMLMFFESKILKNDQKLLRLLSYIFILNLFLIIFLHMIGVYAFFESALITNLLNIVTIVIILYRILYYYLSKKDYHYLLYFIIFGIFSIFLTLEIISFLIKDFDSISLYASIGMVVEFFIVLLLSMIIIFNRNQIIYKEMAYEEIARTDQLTKAKSRFAFENDIDLLFYQSDERVSVTFFDFDDLKNINDQFGHQKGDQLLIDGYQKIKDVFNSYGDTYRIGGDEFACVSTKISQEDFVHLKYIFKKKIASLANELDSRIAISIGFAIEDRSLDEKPSDLIHRSDQDMYKDKSKNKTQDE